MYNDGQTQLADDVDLMRGRHHISMGVNWIYNQLNYGNVFLGNGNFTFNGQSSGDALLDFLLGTPNSFRARATPRWQLGASNTSACMRRTIFKSALDCKCTWACAGNLFCLRGTSTIVPIISARQRLRPARSAAYTRTRRPDCSLSAIQAYRRASSIADGRVSLPASASHGIRTGRVTRLCVRLTVSFTTGPSQLTALTPGRAPWGSTITLSNPAGGLSNPLQGYPGGNPFPGKVPPAGHQVFPTAGAYFDIPLNLRPTYAQQWNLSYQRQLGANWLFSASYLGNKTTHQWDQTEENYGVYIPGTCSGKPCSSTSNLSQRRALYLQNPTAGAFYLTISRSDDGAHANLQRSAGFSPASIQLELYGTRELHLVALH